MSRTPVCLLAQTSSHGCYLSLTFWIINKGRGWSLTSPTFTSVLAGVQVGHLTDRRHPCVRGQARGRDRGQAIAFIGPGPGSDSQGVAPEKPRLVSSGSNLLPYLRSGRPSARGIAHTEASQATVCGCSWHHKLQAPQAPQPPALFSALPSSAWAPEGKGGQGVRSSDPEAGEQHASLSLKCFRV